MVRHRILLGVLVLITAVLSGQFGSVSPEISNVCKTFGSGVIQMFNRTMFHVKSTCAVTLTHFSHGGVDCSISVQREPTGLINMVQISVNKIATIIQGGNVTVEGKRVSLPYDHTYQKIYPFGIYSRFTSKVLLLSVTWYSTPEGVTSLWVQLDMELVKGMTGMCGGLINSGNRAELLDSNIVRDGNCVIKDSESLNDGICREFKSQTRDCLIVESNFFEQLCKQNMYGAHKFVKCSFYEEFIHHCNNPSILQSILRELTSCKEHPCPGDLKYQDQGAAYPPTCSNPNPQSDVKTSTCLPPEDFVLNDRDTEYMSVRVEDCPCVHWGNNNYSYYAPGKTRISKCQTCICVKGKWDCSANTCPPPCIIEGWFVTTFDGKQYSLPGKCTYVAAWGLNWKVTVMISGVTIGKINLDVFQEQYTFSLNSVKLWGKDITITDLSQTENTTVYWQSSMFVMVQTTFGMKMQVQVSPEVQMYLYLPQTVMTRGLCGSYNHNTEDDFTTSSGIVENSAQPFALSWALENCTPDNPTMCTNTDNVRFAEDKCSQLTDSSGVFAKCHNFVPVDKYVHDCVQRTCHDTSHLADHVCVGLGNYAKACASQGINIGDWRAETACTYPCNGNLMFDYAMQACNRTCRAFSSSDPTCDMNDDPVEGCGCPSGTHLNTPFRCSPRDFCYCSYPGGTVSRGIVVIDGRTCLCENGTLQCQDICDCPHGKICVYCGSPGVNTTQRTCESLSKPSSAVESCISGCYCPVGKYADHTGSCVLKEECTCEFSGMVYRSGQRVKSNCKTCTCEGGQWKCTNDLCPGECEVFGNGQYKTFDSKWYRFDGHCQYTLVEDAGSNELFSIKAESVPCCDEVLTCSRSISVTLKDEENEVTLILNDMNVTQKLQKGFSAQSLYSVHTVGLYIIISAAKLGLNVIWDKQTRVKIELQPSWIGKVRGLCGDFDGKLMNDMLTSSSTVVISTLEFGNSWKAAVPPCSDVTKELFPCEHRSYCAAWAQRRCMIVHSDTFEKCHLKVDPTPYYEACVLESCSCEFEGKFLGFCTAVAAYADACRAQNVCIKWRTPDRCPIYCDFYNEEGQCSWHYEACPHQILTCGTNNKFSGKLEGCYPRCPTEMPYFDENHRMCSSLDNCTCYFNNTMVKPGATVITPNGYCSCTKGEIMCDCKDPERNISQPDGAQWTEGCFIYTCDMGNIKRTPVTCLTPNKPVCPSGTAILVKDQQGCCDTWKCYCKDPERNISQPNGSQWTEGCFNHTCDMGVIQRTPVTCLTPNKPVCPSGTAILVKDQQGCCDTWKCSTDYTPTTTTTTATTTTPETTTTTTTTEITTTTITPETTTTIMTPETTTTTPETTTTTTTTEITTTTTTPETTTTTTTTEITTTTTTPETTTTSPETTTTTTTTEITTTTPETTTTTTTTATTTTPETTTTTTTTEITTTTPETTTTTTTTATTTTPETTTTTTTTEITTTTITPETTTTIMTPETTTTTPETTTTTTTTEITTTTTTPETTTTITTPETTTTTTTTEITTTTTTPETTTTITTPETTTTTTTTEITTTATTPETTTTITTPETTTTIITPETTTTTPETTTTTTTTEITTTTTTPETTTTIITPETTTTTPETTTTTTTTEITTTTTTPETTTTITTPETTTPITTPETTTTTTTTKITTTTTTPETTTTITTPETTTTTTTTEITTTTTTTATATTPETTTSTTTTTTTPETTTTITTPEIKTTTPLIPDCKDPERNISQPDGAQWTEGCFNHTCDMGNIKRTPVTCPTPNKPVCPSGTAILVKDQQGCCDIWKCYCKDPERNISQPDGAQWTEGCFNHTCDMGVIQRTPVTCLTPNKPVCPSGTAILVKDQQGCCDTWKCYCKDPERNISQPDGAQWTEGCFIYTCDMGNIKRTPVTCLTPNKPVCPSGTAILVKDQQGCCDTWKCYCKDPERNISQPDGAQWTEGCFNHTCDMGVIQRTPVTCLTPNKPVCPSGTAILVKDQQGCCDTWKCYCKDPERNISQPDGAQWTKGCFIYTCDRGNITRKPVSTCPPLTKPVCPRQNEKLVSDPQGCCQTWQCDCQCDVYGDPHYITFEGKYFAFLENCTYTLVEERISRYNLKISVDNYYCEPHASCVKGVILRYHNTTAKLQVIENPNENPKVDATLNQVSIQPPFQADGLRFETTGIMVYIHIEAIRSSISLTAKNTLQINLAMEHFFNNTQGQCGICGGPSCMRKNGTVESENCCAMTAYEWIEDDSLKPYCQPAPQHVPCYVPPPPPTLPPVTHCDLLRHKVFEKCIRSTGDIDVEILVSNCKFDYSVAHNNETICSPLEYLSEQCKMKGFCVYWRNLTNGICDITCPKGMVFDACRNTSVDFCQGGVRVQGPVLDSMRSGCFCPENQLLAEEHRDICVSTCNNCKGPLGEPMPVGAIWEANCHMCTCNNQTLTEECWPKPSAPTPTCRPGYTLITDCCNKTICVEKTCEFNGKTYKMGDTWRDNQNPCVTFSCTSEGIEKEKMVCPQQICPEELRVWDEHHCCYSCNTTCGVKLSNITFEKCAKQVELPICQGNCASGSMWVRSGNDLLYNQTCCQVKNYEIRQISLVCSGDNVTQYTYNHITSCECVKS